MTVSSPYQSAISVGVLCECVRWVVHVYRVQREAAQFLCAARYHLYILDVYTAWWIRRTGHVYKLLCEKPREKEDLYIYIIHKNIYIIHRGRGVWDGCIRFADENSSFPKIRYPSLLFYSGYFFLLLLALWFCVCFSFTSLKDYMPHSQTVDEVLFGWRRWRQI